jgi:hypothetical protein
MEPLEASRRSRRRARRPAAAGTKDVWDKLQILTALLIPLAVALAGFFVSQGLKRRDIEAQYVSVALEILGRPESQTSRLSRLWAVNVLRAYSPANVPPEMDMQASGISPDALTRGLPGGSSDPSSEASRQAKRGSASVLLVFEKTDAWGYWKPTLYARIDGVVRLRIPGNAVVSRAPHRIDVLDESGATRCSVGQVSPGAANYIFLTCNPETALLKISRSGL